MLRFVDVPSASCVSPSLPESSFSSSLNQYSVGKVKSLSVMRELLNKEFYNCIGKGSGKVMGKVAYAWFICPDRIKLQHERFFSTSLLLSD